MTDMRELDKLEKYLKDNGIKYERHDVDTEYDVHGLVMQLERHQIIVPNNTDAREWDAICQRGSYGHEEGLLEIMGNIVTDEDGESVVGFLTAEDVIERIERKAKNDTGA